MDGPPIWPTLLSPLVTVTIAVVGYFVWRQQMVLKRRFEVAEETLATVEEVVRVLEWARNPGGFSYEGRSRKGDPGESEDLKEERDAYFRSIERLRDNEQYWTALARLRLLCRIHFGEEVTKPLEVLRRAHFEITSATHRLIRMAGTDAPRDQVEKFEQKLWSGLVEEDTFGAEITKARDDLNTLLFAHVRDPFQQLSIWSAWRRPNKGGTSVPPSS